VCEIIQAALPTAIVVLLVATGQVCAQTKTEITRVSLSVLDGSAVKQSSGVLFQSFPERRQYLTDIAQDGTPNRHIKCGSSDSFEAQAESKLDRPVTPIRVPCRATLVFSFKRVLIVTALDPVGERAAPKVYASYANVFEVAGKPAEADVLREAATMAVAHNLGDAKLDQYVFRDPTQGYELVFTHSGEAALKARQVKLGVHPTGVNDAETQNAFAKLDPNSKDTEPLVCTQHDGRFKCQQPPGQQWGKEEAALLLPKVVLPKEKSE
jgi:hypothetical protein